MYALPTVQVTPRGLWRRSGGSAFTTMEAWLGASPDPAAELNTLALRYLAAFGPATPADFQYWSGIPGPGEVFERLRPGLRIVPEGIPRFTEIGWGSVLVDGMVAARWRLLETKSDGTLRIEPFRRLTREERADARAEADRLAAFLAPERDVRVAV